MIRCKDFLKLEVILLECFYILVVLYWQLCERSTAAYYLDYGKIGGQQLSNIWPELKIPDAFSGQFYQTTIALSNLSDYDIRFLVTKVGSQELPAWLEYENLNYSLTGLPLVSDIGVHPLFVLAMRWNETTSNVELLGVQTVAVNVIAANNPTYCDKGIHFVVAEVSLAVNGINLNSTQRIELYQWFVTEFDLSHRTSSIYFKHEPERSNSTGCEVLKSHQANTSYGGPVLTISWLLGCHLTNVPEPFSEKPPDVVLSYPVISWRLLKGNDSTLCFLNAHKSTDVSTHPLEVNKTTYTPPIHAGSLFKTTLPITMSGIIKSVSSGTSVKSMSSSYTKNQQPLETTASFQSNPMTSSTIPTNNFSSVIHATVQQIHFTPVGQSTIILSQPSSTRTYFANNASFGTKENSIVTTPFHMELVTSTLESVREGQYVSTHARSEMVSPSTSFVASTQSRSSQNTDPVVRRPLPILNITSCQYLYYQIPQDTFWDKEDGNTLTLRLLTNNFRELPNDSWIKLDPTRYVIYGAPVSSQIFGRNFTRVSFTYHLSATDSSHSSVSTSVVVALDDDLSPIGQKVSIKVNTQSISFNPLQLIQDISDYLYNGDKATMKILGLSQSSQRVNLTWSDCKAISDVCDVSRVERTLQLIRIDENFLNPHFVIALVPNFVLLNAQVDKLDMCLNEPPQARKTAIHLNMTCCEKFQYDIPHDLFYDQEDGDTRNLTLSIRYSNTSRLRSETWITLNNTSKSIEGVVILEEVQEDPQFDEFFIVAQDSGKLQVKVLVVIKIEQPLPVSSYVASLFIKRLHIIPTPLEEVFIIIKKLSSYFDSETSNEIRALSYSRENAVTVFTWSLADLRFKPCDLDAISNISKKLKGADGEVNDGFRSIMNPEFEVQFIFEERLGHCKEGANEQPTVLVPLHRLRLNLTYFEYQIPVHTFNDLEDGNSPNLGLSLLLPSFESLPVGSWIVLNSRTQIIYGLPDEDAIQAQPIGGYRYLLIGQDSGGKIASSSVLVELEETSRPYNYQITVYLRSYLDASLPCVNHVVEFLGRLSTFIGEDKQSIRIISYNISKNYPADVTITWTNRSANFDTCDDEEITKRFREFVNDEGEVTRSFSDILLPYFIVQDVKLKFLEKCRNAFSNTSPVVLFPVDILYVPIYEVLQLQLPPTMFYDVQDGYTGNLTVVVLDEQNKPLHSSSWIQFDSTKQLLYGLPTSVVAKKQPTHGYIVHVIAKDTDSNEVNSTTRIVVNDTSATVHYLVKIGMVVNTSLDHSDIDLILKFLTKMKTFLGNSDIIVTDYLRNNSSLKVWLSTLHFLAPGCNFAALHELRHRLLFQTFQNTSQVVEGITNYSNFSHTVVQPNENFTRAMLPDFLISTVSEKEKGPCSNTAPVVLQPIPHFIISTPGLFFITLPSNTFYDREDGFTSNLSLTLLSSSGHVLPPNSWLQFNDTTDQIYGVVTEEIGLNKNLTFILNAEDSYGLKVNTSFTIEMTLGSLNVGFKVNIIFKSNFSSIVPHVNIVALLLGKMASYYPDNITFNILSFERGSGIPSTDILSWTVTELDSENCDLERLHEISKKARSSNNEPNEEFKHALLPEFELFVVFEQRLGSCADRLNSLPKAIVSVLNLNISWVPTVFHYKVPRNVFDDTEDGDTRNLTLTLLGESNEEIPQNSPVQLNSPLQILYGIFTESDVNPKSRVVKRNIDSTSIIKKFILLATDSGGRTASSIIEINLGNNVILQNYELHLTFISYLSSTSPDVVHLISFQEKLRGFEGLRDMQVANYARSSGYPAKFEVSFINSSSHINQSRCDFAEIFKITETFQNFPSKPKTEFTTRFLPELVIQEFDIRRFGPCQVLPNNPPTINRIIPVVNITVCEVLKYQIPEDVFLDEDGNSRNLSLNLEGTLPQERNIDWIFLDHLSQILHAVPSLDVVGNQHSYEYVFRLTATDSHGQTAELNFNVFVRDTVLRDSYRLSVVVKVPSMITTKEDLVRKTTEFIEATKRYLGGSANDIRVVEFEKISESLLKVTWSNCSLRYTPCDYQNIEKIRQATIHTGTLPHPKFIQSLAPAFIVESVEDEMRGPCLNQRPVVVNKLEPFNVTLCDGLFEYPLPYDSFFDVEDGYTPNLTLSILSSNSFPLPENYWITIQESQSIIAYPNVDALKAQPKSGYEFLVNAKDSYGLSTSSALKVFYKGEHTKQSNYEVTFVLHVQFPNMTRSTDQVRAIFKILAGYIGGSEKFIRVHSFQRAGVNSSTLFFTWSNCSFSSSDCDLLGIVEISKRLKDADGQISEQLKKAFMPHFVLEFVFEQRLGVCVGDTNVRPKVRQALYQLTVENFCGLWEFQIPPNFFIDVEDGGTRNLTLSLKTMDSMEIKTDSWIQLDQETQTLFGFPFLSNSSNSSVPTRELFILIAADSQGKLATMKLEIIFKNNMPKLHYKVFTEMTSFVEESLSDVHRLKHFIERLSLFLKAETQSIMVTNHERRSNSKLSVSWTNCSVAANMCDANQINIFREKLHLSQGVVNALFSQSMLPYFLLNSVSLVKLGLCKIEAMKSPPLLVRPVGRIFAYSGSLLLYQIPENIFIDEEDGNALNLSLVLQFGNKVPVPYSYWLNFDNISLVITGVLLVENSWERSFRLVARDQHGNEAVDRFEVFVQRRCTKTLLSYQVFTEFVYTENEESLSTKFLKKLELYFKSGFSDTNFTVLSKTAKANNTFLISWSHAKTCGVCSKVNTTIEAISENITDNNGTVLSEFKTAFLPEFILVNISEEKCTPPPAVPIIKGGKEDRWKLYVVPIVVLLIFLLFSFIFFICRGFVFPYESTKEEVILAESPVSEIHVTERIRPTEASMYNSSSTTIINEGYLGNTDAIGPPEILLDKRVSPSKFSLPQDLSPVSTQDVEPVVAPTPPLYSDAVLHLAVESARKPGNRAERPIEMREIPVIEHEIAPTSQAVPSEKLHLDERLSSESIPRSETSDVDGAPPSKPDDTWDTFDYEEAPIPVQNKLRLPTPPKVGMLRLPPVPKPLSNTSPSSLGNSSAGNTPYSPVSSAYSTPLLTPSYSRTTVNNTYNVRQIRDIHSPPDVPQNNYPNPPAYSAYPYGTPMRERAEMGIQSPISYVTPSPLRERTQLGIQSPLDFPFPQGRVPYVDHRQQGTPAQSRPSDLHDVLGQLRETVNRELDRRNEVDKYLDQYLNKN